LKRIGAFLSILLMLCCVPLSFGQDYRATVQGTVTDSSSAFVAGARVTLLNINTGIVTAQETSSQGQYRFGLVLPGTYRVTAELQGFAKSVQNSIAVLTHGDVTIDLVLNPGTQTETITVVASPVELQFNTSTKEMTVTRQQIEDLPSQFRNPFVLATLDPVVVNTYAMAGGQATPYHMWQASQMDFGGRTSRQNDVLIDGAPVQIGPKGSYTPTMDGTQDVAVEQVSVDAEYGHSAGGVINTSTTAGTNAIHGTAYFYGKNPALNASSNSLTHVKSVTRNSQWGGSVGGPIKKNKLFTFANYEGSKTKNPNNTVLTLPTEIERGGDFSQSLNKNGGLRTIYDPLTTVYDSVTGVATRAPFAGNVIPSSRIDPTSAAIMKYIWPGNTTASNLAGANNFRSTEALSTDYWNFSERTDYSPSDNLHIFGRYSRFNALNGLPDFTGINSPAMPNGQGGLMASRNIGADVVYTINPTTVANVRFSYAGFQDNSGFPQSEIGAGGLAKLWPNDAWYQSYLDQYSGKVYFPSLNVNGTGLGTSSLYFQEPHSYNVSAKLAKSLGRHQIKTGIETRYANAFVVSPGMMRFNFSPAMTSSTFLNPNTAVSGDGYASLLLGNANDGSGMNYVAPGHVSIHYYGAYLQDDFKLSRRITLNLGLRYEYESAPVDDQNRYSRMLDLNSPNATLSANPPVYTADELALRSQLLGTSSAPSLNGNWGFTSSSQRTQYNAPKLNFEPKVGIAIRLNDKTALHAGWGRFLVLNSQVGDGLIAQPGFVGYSASSTILPMTAGVPQTHLSDPFPGNNPLQLPTGNALGANTNLGNGYGNGWGGGFRYPDYKNGTLDRFNLTIQHQLPGNIRLEASYMATDGRHLDSNGWWDSFPINAVSPSIYYNATTGPQLNQQVANPFYHYLTPAQFPGSLRNRPTVALSQLLRPYPQYGDLFEASVPIEGDIVQNMEIRLQRAYANGFSFLGSYLYNRERSTYWPSTGDITDGPYYYNRAPMWMSGSSPSYPRHRVVVSGAYELPFGNGRKMLDHAGRLVNGVFGGWSLNSIVNINSGSAMVFTSGDPFVMTGDPTKNVPAGYAFNPAAFGDLPSFTAFNGPATFAGVNGPGSWNIDSNLSKSFVVREGMKLQFRAEAYNLTNSIVWSSASAAYHDSTFGQENLYQANVGRSMQYSLKLFF
jgi:hypothetical protein